MPLFGLLKPAWVRGANGWEAIAAAFIATEVPKAQPDFKGLTKMLQDLSATQRHDAWLRVGLAFKEKGDSRTATRCFVQALFNEPDSASTAWANIELPAGMSGADPLRMRLSALPRRSIAGDRPENSSLAASLRRLVGEPGQG